MILFSTPFLCPPFRFIIHGPYHKRVGCLALFLYWMQFEASLSWSRTLCPLRQFVVLISTDILHGLAYSWTHFEVSGVFFYCAKRRFTQNTRCADSNMSTTCFCVCLWFWCGSQNAAKGRQWTFQRLVVSCTGTTINLCVLVFTKSQSMLKWVQRMAVIMCMC